MLGLHLLRVGVMGGVGQYASEGALCYSRGARVVVRTARGLELAEVLSSPHSPDDSISFRLNNNDDVVSGNGVNENGENDDDGNGNNNGGGSEGTILRRVTSEDELLESRLLR
ncbi:MAG: hypothetical protein N2C14_34265, partial [Planctomycetales bacterium]